MPESEESLRNLINASGFLFQLRVEHEVRTITDRYRSVWTIAREHRWVDPTSGTEGFIDLVVEHGADRIVIECKRVQDGNWVFLIPDKRDQMSRAKLLWTHRQAQRKDLSGWDDFHVAPSSPESAFCTVRGQGERDVPMLERIAGILLRSTEQLASEEIALEKGSITGTAHVYYPMIVTNASLHVCRFSPGDIDLLTGQLPGGEFESVPFIRFRKNLSTASSFQRMPSDLKQANVEYERTVFVVNIAELANVLKEWEAGPFDRFISWPWVRARQQEGNST